MGRGKALVNKVQAPEHEHCDDGDERDGEDEIAYALLIAIDWLVYIVAIDVRPLIVHVNEC